MPGVALSRIILLVIAALLAFGPSPAAAQRGLAGKPLGVCVAPVAAGDTPRAMLAAHARFDCVSDQVSLGRGDFWALSQPVPVDAGTRHVRVRVGSLWQSGLTLYAVYADGAIVAMPSTSATLARRLQLGAIVEFAPPWRPAPLVRLLWRIDESANVRGILIGQRIADAGESARANMLMAALYSGFAGLALALLIYNLSLWGALRHRFQLTYCAMVVALVGYAASSSGALAWVFPQIDNNDRIRINYVLLGFAASMAIVFARAFFEPRVFRGWLGRAANAATVVLGLSGIIYAALSYFTVPFADRIAALLFLFGLSVTVPILWNAWRRGSRYLLIFTVAWAAPVFFAAARILAALHVLPSTFWLDNSTVISLSFEALVSSIAIAFRVQMLSKERDEALAGELQARLLADADPLTGLLNRRAFLGQAIGRGGPQTLHLIDIDHFKAVNDTLGHDGGDEVLRVFARTLRSAVPQGGLIARLGGEEFAVVVSGPAPIDADQLLARLRAARMPFDLTVTSSIGTCIGPIGSEGDWKTLYRNADRALFEAKTAGRDRSRRAPGVAIAA